MEHYLRDHAKDGCKDVMLDRYFPQLPFCPKYHYSTNVTYIEEEILTRENLFSDTSTYKIFGLYASQGAIGVEGYCFVPCKTFSYHTEVIDLPYMGNAIILMF